MIDYTPILKSLNDKIASLKADPATVPKALVGLQELVTLLVARQAAQSMPTPIINDTAPKGT